MNSTQRTVHWLVLLTLDSSCSCTSFLVTQPIALVARLRSALLVLSARFPQLHSHPKELLQYGQFCGDQRATMVVCRSYQPI